jgi:hypothetical protein
MLIYYQRLGMNNLFCSGFKIIFFLQTARGLKIDDFLDSNGQMLKKIITHCGGLNSR